MHAIVVIDPSNVTVDGQPAGAVTDVLANYPDSHVPLLAALKAHIDGIHATHKADIKALGDKYTADVATVQTNHDTTVANLQAHHKAAIKAQADQHTAALDAADKTAATAREQLRDALTKQVAKHKQSHDATRARLAAMETRFADPAVRAAWEASHPGRKAALLRAKSEVDAELAKLDAATSTVGA